MNQRNLFSLKDARRLRDEGKSRVGGHNESWLGMARYFAREWALRYGTVTSDDVQRMMGNIDWQPTHPNAWGVVFRGKGWVWTGEMRQSKRIARHAGLQKVWRYEPA